jgi:hypothetical protein
VTQTYEAAAMPLIGRWFIGALPAPLQLNPYEAQPMAKSPAPPAAKSSDFVTWTQVVTLIMVMIAVVGGGFTWMHVDMSDLKSGITDLTKQVSGVREGVGVTNQKLDDFIQEVRRGRR